MATALEPQEDHQSEHHDDWHHKPFSAHHFDNAEQQFDSGKLGMWLFLVTEILFFSGLFCAYAVYRANHPEVFIYASQFLDKNLGGLNTIVLIFSSLTMAWAVRCAQIGKRIGLITMLGVTLFCAALFLGVKTFEYTEKAHKRLVWAGAFVDAKDIGKSFSPTKEGEDPKNHVFRLGEPLPESGFEDRFLASLVKIRNWWLIGLVPVIVILGIGFGIGSRPLRTTACGLIISIFGIVCGIETSVAIHHAMHSANHGEAHAAGDHGEGEHSAEEKTAEQKKIAADIAEAEKHEEIEADQAADPLLSTADLESAPPVTTPVDTTDKDDAPRNANIFFSIYYFMTGLHAFHIICGMGAIIWLMVRSVESHFRPDYFGPVDFVGLYWHIVDLIWIYLFPLLYLIGS